MSNATVTAEPKSKKKSKAEVSAEPAAPVASAFALESSYGARAGMPAFLAFGIQRKLAVGAVDDPLEREADRVAEHVMRSVDISSAPPVTPTISRRAAGPTTFAANGTATAASATPEQRRDLAPTGPAIQRKCACEGASGGDCEECRKREEEIGAPPAIQRKSGSNATGDHAAASEAPPIVHEALRSPGKPLDDSVRPLMESRFGRDFSDVRVHTDSVAAQSAQAVNAHAYTAGKNLVFADGKYSPHSSDGGRLLAHELTHVVQQSGAGRLGGSQASPGAIRRQAAPPSPKSDDNAAPAPDVPPSAGPAKPPDPGPETISFDGVVFSADPGFVRWQLDQEIAKHGEPETGGLVGSFEQAPATDQARLEASEKLKKDLAEYGGEVSGAPLGEHETAEIQQRVDNSERTRSVIAVVRQQFDLLRAEDQQLLTDFEDMAVKAVLERLDSSKAQVMSEMHRYGLTDAVISKLQPSPFPQARTAYDAVQQMRQPQGPDRFQAGQAAAAKAAAGEQKGLIEAAKQLQAKRDEINRLQQQEAMAPPGQAFVPAPQTAFSVRPLINAQGEYAALRREKEAQYPILAVWAQQGGDLGELLNAGGGVSNVLANEIRDKLDKIERSQQYIGQRTVSIWDLEAVVDSTQRNLRIDAGTRKARIIQDHASSVRKENESTREFLDTLVFALALLAPIPVVGEVAGVAAAGIGIYLTYTDVVAYQQQSALSGMAFDKAAAISQEEPSLFWLALEIVGTVAAVSEAAASFRKLTSLRRLAVAAKVRGDLTEAEGLLNSLQKEGDDLGQSGIGSRLKAETEEVATARAKHAAEFEEIEQNLGRKRPSKLPGYTDEIPVDDTGKHFWRKKSDGTWCRFSATPTFCFTGGTLEGEALEEQLQEFELEGVSRDQLKARLGEPPKLPGKWQAHHIIPFDLQDHEVLRRIGFDINRLENGVWLPEEATGKIGGKVSTHLGSHPVYSYSIEARLNNLIPKISELDQGLITQGELESDVMAIMDEYRARMVSDFKGTKLP